MARKRTATDDMVCATRKVGPYEFEFVIRNNQRFVQLYENDQMIWESSPFGPKDDRTMRRRILVGLTVLASRLSVLHEKVLVKIHEIAV